MAQAYTFKVFRELIQRELFQRTLKNAQKSNMFDCSWITKLMNFLIKGPSYQPSKIGGLEGQDQSGMGCHLRM